MCTNGAAEREDCVEVYLDHLFSSCQSTSISILIYHIENKTKMRREDERPHSNHYREIQHSDDDVGSQHNSRGFVSYVHLSGSRA